MELQDKVCVITGGSGGIGQAMAKAFLKEGAQAVVLADLSQEAVDAAAADISSLGACEGKACDVTDEAQIQALVDHTLASVAVPDTGDAGTDALCHAALVLTRRVADAQLEQEAIELRLGQRIRTLLFDRVLRRDDEEWARELQGPTADRDRGFLHRFE